MPNTSDCPAPDHLAAFDQGLLGPTDQAAVERHVGACDRCCRLLEGVADDTLVRRLRHVGAGETVPHAADPAHAPPDLPAELRDHPRYRVVRLLGAGGMGAVYQAEHRLMGRPVALKVVHPRLLDAPAAVDRFRHEVRAAARLVHPHIVLAFDADQAGPAHFLVMEYVPGASLDRVVRERGRLPAAEACDLVRQAAVGLQAAFEAGMVHRDVKPGNLIVTPDGRVKVLDFGLARFAREAAGGAGLTPAGAVVGTPDYLAPEQADDPRAADVRADVYSLGCTLYHLLAGRPPFPHGTVVQKLVAHREKAPPPLDAVAAGLPAGLGGVVARMLAKRPEARYPTPAAVADALTPFCVPGPVPFTPSRRSRRWAAAAAAVSLLALVGVVVLPRITPPSPPAMGSAAVALKDIEPAAAPPAPPAVPPAPAKPAALPRVTVHAVFPRYHQAGVTDRTRREAIIAWYNDQCPDGPASAADDAWADRLRTGTRPQHDLHLVLGPGVVRSRKVTFVSSYGDGLFAFELAPADVAPLYVGDKQVKVNVKGHAEARADGLACADLALVATRGGQQGVELTLRTQYARRGPTAGALAMRVYEYPFDRADAVRYVPLGPAADEGRFEFTFAWAAPVRAKQPTAPTLFFFEPCTTAEPGQYRDVTVVGTTQAALFRARWDDGGSGPPAP